MIFIDSDVYIAFYYKQDVHHSLAIRIVEKLTIEQTATSWDVVDEVSTKLSRFINKRTAETFVEELLSSDTTVYYPNASALSQTLELFSKQSSKTVSWTDCANIVIARELGIKTFFSFDHHYEQNGFTLLGSK